VRSTPSTAPGGVEAGTSTPIEEISVSDFADVRRYFDRGAVAHIATIMPDGAPHSVPIWVGVEGDRLAFFTLEGSRKDRDVQADPRVAISVTNPAEPLDMAFVRGVAVERFAGDDAMPIVDRIARAYTGEDYDVRTGLAAFVVEPRRSWANDYTAG
jgi:PPOX class probable F420-dependent enzyme